MEPPSNETEKDKSHSEEDYVIDDSETAVHENEFQKCLRKGRRDACPEIQCKGTDSEHSEQCLFHKEAVESNTTSETVKEKT